MLISSESLDSTTHMGEKYGSEEENRGEIKNMFV